MAKGQALIRARRQAQAAAAVRFDPQQRVLVDALGTARAEEGRAVRSAKGTASALGAAIRGARKPLRQGYTDAAQTATAARGDLLGHLAGLGAPAAPFSAAVAREQAGVTSRAAQERANAEAELALRGVQAQEGRASSIQNAHSQFGSAASTIYRQLTGIASDRGTFTAQQLGDIQQAQRAIAAQNARARIAAKATTDNSKRTAQSAADKLAEDARHHHAIEGKKPKPKAEVQGSHKIKAQVVDARAAYERGLAAGWSGKKIAREARKQKVPEHVLVAAADLANFGYVTPGHLRALRQAGVTHIPAAWKHPRRVLPSVAAANRLGHAQ